MNRFTLFSKEFRETYPWLTAIKEREAKKTPTYEMQQREPMFSRVSNEVAERIEDIKADFTDLPLQPAYA